MDQRNHVLALGVVGLVVSVNSRRFARHVAREAREMWGSPTEPRSTARASPESDFLKRLEFDAAAPF